MSRYKNVIRYKLHEAYLYPEGMIERMHPKLVEDLESNKHSLGDHPAFPQGDEVNFATKVMSDRFKEVVERCRRAFDVDQIDSTRIMMEMMPLVKETMAVESNHKAKLEKLAIEMIKEEFDIDDEIDFDVKLTMDISRDGVNNKSDSDKVITEFEDHAELEMANDSVYKRRLLNAMTQGAAKKTEHMYHMVERELEGMNSRLPNLYNKTMSAADYCFYLIPNIDKGVDGRSCEVDFENMNEEDGNTKPVIKARAMIFPVLLHEMVKGVMEVLSAHGLPTQKNIAEYVLNKADFVEAEPWDMRLGPALWSKLCEAIPANDFDKKHYIYADLAALPSKEFNATMKEIFAGTRRGKAIISEMLTDIKRELKEDSFNEQMGDDYFSIEELLS